MAYTEDQVRAALRNALTTFTLRDLGSMLTEEQQKLVSASEAAKPIPALPMLSPADWQTLKTFLLDGGGDRQFQAVAARLRKAIVDDDQPAFWLAMFLLFKAVRLAFIGEEGL